MLRVYNQRKGSAEAAVARSVTPPRDPAELSHLIRRSAAPLFLAVGLSLCADTEANALRCGKFLVLEGATKVEVLDKCGAPQHKEQISGEDGPKKEVWYYRRGSEKFPRLLTFRGIKLVQIEVLRQR